jgi:hypothetical protein
MWAKIMQFAPVILATGTTAALFAITIDDPKTKRIIRGIALMLGIGTAFSLIQQLPAVSAALGEGVALLQKGFGLDAESRQRKIQDEAKIEAMRVKAAQDADSARTKAAADAIANQARIAAQQKLYEDELRRAKADAEAAVLRANRDAADARAKAARLEVENREALKRAEDSARDERVRRAQWEMEQDRQRRAQQDRRNREDDCASWNSNIYLPKKNC